MKRNIQNLSQISPRYELISTIIVDIFKIDHVKVFHNSYETGILFNKLPITTLRLGIGVCMNIYWLITYHAGSVDQRSLKGIFSGSYTSYLLITSQFINMHNARMVVRYRRRIILERNFVTNLKHNIEICYLIPIH